MCKNRLFFNVLKVIRKVILLENSLPFWDRERLRTLSNAMHAQLTRKFRLHGLVEMHCFLWIRSLEFHEVW